MSAINNNTVSAENQTINSSDLYFLGDKDAKTRMLIVGNSITRHGPNKEIGWERDWGMAADSPDKDYVHILQRKLEENGKNVFTMVRQGYIWEGNYTRPDILNDFSVEHDFNADIAIFRLGENISRENLDEKKLYNGLQAFIKHICPLGKVIFTTCFWENPVVDEVIRRLAEERGDTVVELGDLGADDSMTAKGKFEHSGVAAHPGNAGMKAIAERIYTELKNCL